MAPLADAMRLVDGEQGDPGVRKHLAEARRRQPFGSDIEQVELAARQRAPDGSGVFGAQRRIQRRGADAGLAQGLDLVAHQRDQRRNDDADTRPADRRDLIAGGLAGAGRKQHHRIAAIADVAHHVFLLAPESSVPEHLAQHVERVPDGLGLQRVQMQLSVPRMVKPSTAIARKHRTERTANREASWTMCGGSAARATRQSGRALSSRPSRFSTPIWHFREHRIAFAVRKAHIEKIEFASRLSVTACALSPPDELPFQNRC